MSSSHRGAGELVAACSAAFAVGCSLGALGMRYYEQHAASSRGEQQTRLTAEALTPLSQSGLVSAAPSMCSYSLPPTPRMNGGRDAGASLGGSTSAAGGGGSGEGLRMVFVVRRDLGWSRQKLAVMTAHSAVALFKKLFKARHPALTQWELAKGPKLVLRADDEAALVAVLNAARSAGVPNHVIAEAGPSGSSARSSDVGGGSSGGAPDVPRRSRTILALGPLPAEEIAKFAPGLVLL